MKNREAARECRRKKKEYIKCLENRVAVLENQNKALIEELKSLKELYTGSRKKNLNSFHDEVHLLNFRWKDDVVKEDFEESESLQMDLRTLKRLYIL